VLQSCLLNIVVIHFEPVCDTMLIKPPQLLWIDNHEDIPDEK